jgi:hypothetical protein
MGRLDKVIVFNVLIVVIILVCVSLDVSRQKEGRSNFLEGIFGFTHIPNTILKIMFRHDKMNEFNVLIIIMIFVCVCFVSSSPELRLSTFLLGVFGLTSK